MSEAGSEVTGTSAGESPVDRRAEAEQVLGEILRRMGFPARFEFKDAPDGALLVAMHFEGEQPPGINSGKRSSPLDSLQLIANKIVNRPGTPKRWMQLGVGAFPEPRAPKGERQPKQPQVQGEPGVQVATAAPAASPALRQPRAEKQPRVEKPPRVEKQQRPQRGAEPDERSLEVAEDPALTSAAKSIAEKASKLGRYYAVVGTTPEQRAQLLRGGEGTEGVTVKTEGEGFLRRLVFVPAKPVPLPKRPMMPDFDDEVDA